MTQVHSSRREFLKRTSVGIAIAGFSPVLLAQENLTIGIVYVGPANDLGWNNAHAAGIASLRGLPGVRIVQEERVPETNAVASTMEGMIRQDGARLILGTSYGYFDPHMVALARKYPQVQFRHPAMLWNKDKHPMNLGSYYCYLDQAHYVDGVAAGLSTKSNKIGFVAPKAIPIVLRNINSVLAGARKVNPNATVTVIFTGDWSLPIREAEATNALIDAGCDVIATQVDNPKVLMETAERRGAKTCGTTFSQASMAPKGFVTGAENKYETVYRIYADYLKKGETLPNVLIGGYDKDMIRNTPFGPGATDAARNAATAAIADMKAGKPVFAGALKDNKGKVIAAATSGNYDPILERMDYLLEGVVGSTT